jgi:hypothetical protein
MNIEEAKTKWCPMARSTTMDYPSSNRHFWKEHGDICCDNNPKYARCIAEDCACWVDDTAVFKSGHCGLAR